MNNLTKIETVFDHEITQEELRLLGFSNYDINNYQQLDLSEQTTNTHLYRLYLIRGDKTKSQIYLDRIPNSFYKTFDLSYRDYFPQNK